jgi:hypothetical protein
MKIIERWYEKLLGYDWEYQLRKRFTLVEVIVILLVIVLIVDWLVRGDV